MNIFAVCPSETKCLRSHRNLNPRGSIDWCGDERRQCRDRRSSSFGMSKLESGNELLPIVNVAITQEPRPIKKAPSAGDIVSNSMGTESGLR